jgi:hypothetical protein
MNVINARTTSKIRRLAGAAALGVAALCTIGAPLGVSALSAATASAAVVETGTLALDKLVLRSGKVIEGQVLRETATEVEFKVIVAGISAPATFKKSQIIEIVRGDTDPADAIEPEEIDDNPLLNGDDSRTIEVEEMASIDSPKVYVINLKGEFGKEISPTPVRDAVQAAEKEQPDFLIVHLDNTWKYQGQDAPDELQGSFDQFGIADKIEPIFTKEIDLEWEKKPHVVFWVGNAMGGAAFLPFLADEVFYEPDGRIGGIGSLEQMFEGVGDEIVRQKQRSLRLARAQGLAIANGYDYRLINALAQVSYVLSYDPDTGEMFERMPQGSEVLLTDDGKGDNRDVMMQLVRGEGNDVLTLKEKDALQLGFSSGTAADLDELLELLGILRNHVLIEGRSDQILESWARNVDSALRRIPRLRREFEQVQPQGNTLRDRRQAISRQISILEEIQGIARRYGESFDPNTEGLIYIANLETEIEQLRIQLLLLRD